MLVLSRKESEQIKFPGLGITIEVLKVHGQKVRVGVDAPVEVKVLRGELDQSPGQPELTRRIRVETSDQHELRNRLNALSLAIAVAEKQLQRNQPELAANLLDQAIERFANQIEGNAAKNAQSNTEYLPEDEAPVKVRALLVEDVANERQMLAGFLRLHGLHVDSVGDGCEALKFLEENCKPDFILMDMQLPNLDGASTIRSIRSTSVFDDVEIFAISGQTPESTGISLQKNRIANWFQKPLEPRKLVSAMLNNGLSCNVVHN